MFGAIAIVYCVGLRMGEIRAGHKTLDMPGWLANIMGFFIFALFIPGIGFHELGHWLGRLVSKATEDVKWRYWGAPMTSLFVASLFSLILLRDFSFLVLWIVVTNVFTGTWFARHDWNFEEGGIPRRSWRKQKRRR